MWIKTRNLKPRTHDVILFQDRWGNQHYGVLCGEFVEHKKRGKYWCHIFNKTYSKKDIVYWCDIPTNKDLIDGSILKQIDDFLHLSSSMIEKQILEEFQRLLIENPNWEPKSFVEIATRNSLFRLTQLLTVSGRD